MDKVRNGAVFFSSDSFLTSAAFGAGNPAFMGKNGKEGLDE